MGTRRSRKPGVTVFNQNTRSNIQIPSDEDNSESILDGAMLEAGNEEVISVPQFLQTMN